MNKTAGINDVKGEVPDIAKKLDTKMKKHKKLIYCGPTVPNVIKQYALYEGALSVQVVEAAVECPYIEKLLVPMGSLALMQSNTATNGTPESIWCNKILEFMKR